MIGFSKILTGKATVAATLHGEASHSLPPHLLQFSTSSRPVVVWNLTRRCNLRCCHCYLEAGAADKNELDHDQASRLVEELAGMQIPVLLFSGGEPLLREDLFELARQAHRLGIRIGLSTNGTLIDHDTALKLAGCGFSYVGVSLDGSETTHDRFRGVAGSFGEALAGLRTAREAGLKTGVRFTVNRDNFGDLPQLLQLVRTEGIPRFCLYHLVYAGRGKEMQQLDLTPAQERELVEYLITETLRLAEEGVELEILTTDQHADGIYLYHWIEEHQPQRAAEVRELLARHGGCSAGVKMANIDPCGYVYPCQFWRSEAVGKYPEQSFAEIWQNDDNPLLSSLRNKATNLRNRCGDCGYNSLCGGCRIRAEVVNGGRWEADPSCYLTDEEIAAS